MDFSDLITFPNLTSTKNKRGRKSKSGVLNQEDFRATRAEHQQVVSKTSAEHQQVVSKTSAKHQRDVSKSSAKHQQVVSKTSAGHPIGTLPSTEFGEEASRLDISRCVCPLTGKDCIIISQIYPWYSSAIFVHIENVPTLVMGMIIKLTA